MDMLQQLYASHRRCAHHVQVALFLALMPLFLAGILIFAHRGSASTGFWMVAGMSAGLAMMLWGAHRMHRVTLRRSRLATRLVERSDAWFPHLVILIQGGIAAAFSMLAWFTIVDLGYASTAFQEILLLSLLLLWPARRCLRFSISGSTSLSGDVLHSFLYHLQRVALALFVASTLSRALVPPEQRQSSSFPMLSLLIWIPAVLVVLVQIVLFLDHITRKAPQQPEADARDRIE